MGLALVVVKKDTGRTVELAHDDPFRSVDDKGPAFRHQGNFAKVDFLLLDVPDGLLLVAAFRVEHNKPHHDLQGRGIGHPLLNAFLDIVLHVSDLVTHKLQRAFSAEIPDREHALKGALETDIASLLWIHIHLQEFIIGFSLDLDEIRNVDNLPDMSEIFSEFAHSHPQMSYTLPAVKVSHATKKTLR